MKILHLLGDRNLPRRPDDEGAGGVVRAALEIARAQAGLGHEVSIAVITRRPWRAEWQGVRLIGLAAAPWARMRLNGKVLDFRQHLPYVLFTTRHTFDIAHAHAYGYMRFVRAGRRVAHIHNDPSYRGGSNDEIDLKAADFRCIAQHSDAQVAVSRFVGAELERGMGDAGNVHVVFNGADLARFDPARRCGDRQRLRRAWGVSDSGVVFVYAGGIAPEKGVLHLAQAFVRLAADMPNVYLALAGTSTLWDGALGRQGIHQNYEREVQCVLGESPAATRVRLLGQVPASEMPAVYAAGDALVVPSICREAFSLAALEGLASARPVIASGAGGILEVVDERCGMLIPPGDEAALEVAMRGLAENPALRARMGNAAWQQAQHFSWDDAAQQLESIYQSIL